jgi:hypothetical protein
MNFQDSVSDIGLNVERGRMTMESQSPSEDDRSVHNQSLSADNQSDSVDSGSVAVESGSQGLDHDSSVKSPPRYNTPVYNIEDEEGRYENN